MKRAIAATVYNLLLFIYLFVDVVKWLWSLFKQTLLKIINKLQADNIKRDGLWLQKFVCWLPTHIKTSENNAILHCASMGEVVAAAPVIKDLLTKDQQLNLIVTTNTLTGKQQVTRLKAANPNLANRIVHHYWPIDLPWLMKRFINKIKPRFAMVMEVELWPNFINQCYQHSVPVVIINGRLTDKTSKGLKKLAWLSKPMFKQLNRAFVRNNNDYQNYCSFMAAVKVKQLGNIKFDITTPNTNKIADIQQQIKNRVILIAGSTHDGEETLAIEAYKKLKPSNPELLLMVAPRHPHRFDVVNLLLQQQQLSVARLQHNELITETTDVVLCDQMGVLGQLYSTADIAFIGGSFAKKGGHNPIEASIFSVPVVMGPHVFNNPEICYTLADAGALTVCETQQAFMEQVELWMKEPTTRLKAGEQGALCIKQHQGIVATLTDYVLSLDKVNERRI